MFSFSPKKISFALVSAFALNIALQPIPAKAMEEESAQNSQISQQNILERINYYYENIGKFQEYLNPDASDDESDDDLIDLFISEADKGNLKAKILCFFAMIYDEDNPYATEWEFLHEWLSSQNKDPMALIWLGTFEKIEWKDHPVDLNKAKQYYKLAVKEGNTSAYEYLSAMYHYGPNGLAVDIEKAKKYYKRAIENGHTSAHTGLAHLYSTEGPAMDLNEAEKCHLISAKSGNPSAYFSLGCMFHFDIGNHPAEPEKALKYYLLSAEKDCAGEWMGQIGALCRLGDLHQQEWPGHTAEPEKSEHYYKLVVEKGKPYNAAQACSALSSLYKKGWEKHAPNVNRALHWNIKSFQIFDGDCTVKMKLREILFLAELQDVSLDLINQCKFYSNATPTIVTAVEETESVLGEEEQNWENAVSWLMPLAGKMHWKYGEYLQQDKMLTNKRKAHKPEGQEFYERFGTTLEKVSRIFPKALDEKFFIFMNPKETVTNHLLSCFSVSDPLISTSSDEVGLRLYNLSGKTVLAFGNDNVKLADEVIQLLDGKDSLNNLIKHHQQKKELLERFLSQKQKGLGFDTETCKLECSLFNKPEYEFFWEGEEPKLSFTHFLLSTLQKSFCISDEKAQQCISNARKRITTNPSINQCIEEELIKYIGQKITKREEKIELLQGIVDSYQERLTASHAKKVARFKEEYPYLGDMFD